MDSVPLVAITGQVSRAVIGTDAFQESDTVGITRSVTKHNELVMRAEDIALAVRQAFLLATTGRPGPVLLDLPKDILQAKTEWYWPNDHEVTASLPGYKPTIKGHPANGARSGAHDHGVATARDLCRRRDPQSASVRSAWRKLAELDERSRRHHAYGPGRLPRQPPPVLGDAGHARQLCRHYGDAGSRSADRPRHPLRRQGYGPGQLLRPRGQNCPRRHRPGRTGQNPPARGPDSR